MVEKQFVVFKIDNEQYGISINHIQEICRYQEITKIPQNKPFMMGVINYRGNVIPIIDIRKKFNLSGETVITDNTRIIITIIGNLKIGILVDEASSTVKLTDDVIEHVPSSIDTSNEVDFIGKSNGTLISLINIEKVIGKE